MKNGAKVRILVEVDGFNRVGDTGTVQEYPYTGDDRFAWVNYDKPRSEANGYAYAVRELDIIG